MAASPRSAPSRLDDSDAVAFQDAHRLELEPGAPDLFVVGEPGELAGVAVVDLGVRILLQVVSLNVLGEVVEPRLDVASVEGVVGRSDPQPKAASSGSGATAAYGTAGMPAARSASSQSVKSRWRTIKPRSVQKIIAMGKSNSMPLPRARTRWWPRTMRGLPASTSSQVGHPGARVLAPHGRVSARMRSSNRLAAAAFKGAARVGRPEYRCAVHDPEGDDPTRLHKW
jgi:hypothetical protein